MLTPISATASSVVQAITRDSQSATRAYTVREGDTSWQIAGRYGLTADELRQLNPDLAPRQISQLQA
ncbi:LysM peptidoglycan-binding domain-containing protein [Salmonella enterica]|nr:LysM peptidoglycan-binding domain-containing protein [Salmonella enterica]